MEKIKIGGITYDIEYKDTIDVNGDLNYFGTCDKKQAKIEISTLANKQRQEQTLVHEILHAVFYEAGIVLDNEEDIVNRVSLVLYQVLKDNDICLKE